MGAEKYYRKYIEKLINYDPAKITITRKIKKDDGAGGATVEEKVIEETVTFYERKTRREALTDSGKVYVGVKTSKILAKYDADIKEGDIFSYEGKQFRVSLIHPFPGICKQIELEVIA